MNMSDPLIGRIEAALSSFLNEEPGRDAKVYEAARYSLLAGGKRVRPLLLLTFASLFGVKEEDAMPFACALEYIHTYSLIHDDLPAMDNDDLRRGRPTNHVVYGEGMALLAGDALLNRAYEIILSHLSAPSQIAAGAYIAEQAGVKGMIGGQCIDLSSAETAPDADLLSEMHDKKTGALIRAACVGGALLGTSDEKTLCAVTRYADELGLAFQIIDDVLDVTGEKEILGKSIGKDAQENKLTFVSVFGLEKAKAMAKAHTENALSALDELPPSPFLKEYTVRLLNRNY